MNFNLRILLIAGMIFSGGAFSSVKIGVVNLQKTLATVKKGKRIKAKLESESKRVGKMVNNKQAAFKKEFDKLRASAKVLSPKDLATKEASLQKQNMELQKYMQEQRAAMQRKQVELTKPLFQEMEKLLPEISKKYNVDMTVEVASGSVLYAKDQVDLTDELIKAYNKKYK